LSSAEDPIEGQAVYEQDYDGGKMDGFARTSGAQSLAYFDQTEIAAYWTYAEEYGLAENYFAPVFSTTNPNRLMLLAGDSSVADNEGPPPFFPYNDTILHQLSTAGISWAYFDFFLSAGGPNLVPPINYLSGLDSSALQHIQDTSAFFQDLTLNQLPAVTFLNAIGFDTLDEHPPSNVTTGELWVVSIINAVMESSYWMSSAILVTYDEGGGYYDHVAPPQLLTVDHGFNMPLHGYGQRVPLLVVSPYAKENYVSDTLLNHMSILRFIEYNWNLPSLNQNVTDSNNLLDLFYFDGPPRAPIILTSTGPYSVSSYPAPIQIPFDQLPYSRNGSSIPANSSKLPLIQYVALAVGIVIVVLVLGKLHKRRP
jgi:phospholipase C